jgi:hypothetical protein
VLAGRIGLGGAKALREADQQDPDRHRSELEIVDGGHTRQPEGGQARLNRADDGRAVPVQVGQLDDDNPEHDRGKRPGNHRSDPPQPQDQRQRPQPDQQRQPAGLAELAGQMPQLLEEVALALGDPEQLGQLPDDDREGQADDEALEHRLGDEVGHKAQPRQPRDDPDDAGGDRQRDGQGGEPAAAPGR